MWLSSCKLPRFHSFVSPTVTQDSTATLPFYTSTHVRVIVSTLRYSFTLPQSIGVQTISFQNTPNHDERERVTNTINTVITSPSFQQYRKQPTFIHRTISPHVVVTMKEHLRSIIIQSLSLPPTHTHLNPPFLTQSYTTDYSIFKQPFLCRSRY